MGACLSSIKRLFAKPATPEEYIYLPARSPKRSFHTPTHVQSSATTEVVVEDHHHHQQQEEEEPQVVPPKPVDPEVLRKQHDELIQRQSSFIHLKLSVENLVRENKELGADDGAWCLCASCTRGCGQWVHSLCCCMVFWQRDQPFVCWVGDEILSWLDATEGSPATIYQDILDTKNILSELKKQNEDLRGRGEQTPNAAATSTRRAARSKNKNAFAAVQVS